MDSLIQQSANALALGATYALLAVGLAIVFSIMNLVNFAHGELLTIAGYALFFAGIVGLAFPLAALIAIILAAIAALAMDRIAFRPLRGASGTSLLLASLALSVTVQILFQNLVDPRGRPVAVPAFLRGSVEIGPVQIGAVQVAAMVVAAITLSLLTWFFSRSAMGVSLRAAASDFETTRLMGVKANSVVAAGVALSGAIAGVAGILWVAQRTTVDPGMGLTPVLKAFIAVIVGGMGSIKGAVLAAMLLGGLEVLAETMLPANLQAVRDGFVWLVVVLVLLVRPTGLIATAEDRA